MRIVIASAFRFMGVALGLAALVSGCSPTDSKEAVSRRFSRGDSIVIEVRGPGRWGNVVAQPVLRLATITPNLPFAGANVRLAAALDGGVVLVDSDSNNTPAMFRFDSLGGLRGAIGRHGAGPGEYTGSMSAYITPTNEVLTADAGVARVQWYNDSGVARRSINLPAGTGAAYPTTDGVAVPADMGRTILFWDTLGSEIGKISLPNQPPLGPKPFVLSDFVKADNLRPLSDGRTAIVISSDRVGFVLLTVDSNAKPVVVERPTEPLAFHPEEYDELKRAQHILDPAVVISTKKQLINALLPYGGGPDLYGRVWIPVRKASIKSDDERLLFQRLSDRGNVEVYSKFIEPRVFAVFTIEGEYLGEVSFPHSQSPIVFSRHHAWSMETDSAGIPQLVKYRLPTE